MVVSKNSSALDFYIPLIFALSRDDEHAKLKFKILIGVADWLDTYVQARESIDFIEKKHVSIFPPVHKLFYLLFRLIGTKFFITFNSIIRLDRVLSYISATSVKKFPFARSQSTILLLDLRSRQSHLFSKAIEAELGRSIERVFFIPHAPVYVKCGDQLVQPSPENYEHLTDRYLYLLPFIGCSSSKYERTIDFGYPMFFDSFISYVKTKMAQCPVTARKKILVLLRKPDSEGDVSNFTTSDKYNVDLLKSVLRPISANGECYEILIKPHPAYTSRDLVKLASVVPEGSKITLTYTYSPIYSALIGVRCVIGDYSSVMLMPCMIGLPTFSVFSEQFRFFFSNTTPDVKSIYQSSVTFLDKYDDWLDHLNSGIVNRGELFKSYFQFSQNRALQVLFDD